MTFDIDLLVSLLLCSFWCMCNDREEKIVTKEERIIIQNRTVSFFSKKNHLFNVLTYLLYSYHQDNENDKQCIILFVLLIIFLFLAFQKIHKKYLKKMLNKSMSMWPSYWNFKQEYYIIYNISAWQIVTFFDVSRSFMILQVLWSFHFKTTVRFYMCLDILIYYKILKKIT